MKKILILILLFSISFVTVGQPIKTKYIELNTGFATGIVPFFPGASFLYGATNYYSNGMVLDYEAGVALPSIITGKIGAGFMVNTNELTFGIRPFPSTYYVQTRLNRPNKKSDIIISIESGLYYRSLLSQSAILTIGWRWDNKKYRDLRHKGK